MSEIDEILGKSIIHLAENHPKVLLSIGVVILATNIIAGAIFGLKCLLARNR